MIEPKKNPYELSTGTSVVTLSPFSSPVDEYLAAFEDQALPFLYYYTFEEGNIQRCGLTRGEFWDRACSVAAYIRNLGISEGDRVLHCFSSNNLYDLILRLTSVLMGSIPVTINWQTDDNERIVYKAKVTESRICIYDKGFASRVEELKSELPEMVFLEDKDLEKCQQQWTGPYAQTNYNDERIIIFTSGTTDKPKGVCLSHRSYLTNKLTYESYFRLSETTPVDLLLVNPLHHANSTALSDWALRRRGAILHLLERYTTRYWKVLPEAMENKRGLFIISLVPRHIDFLDNLSKQGDLPVNEDNLRQAMNHADILIGSAPVGPTTIKRVQKYAGKIPHVRFGSTETCLQVTAIPITMTENAVMNALVEGWSHRYNDREVVGYYIGREHFPFTTVRIVKSISPDTAGYMMPCDIGEPGYLVIRGGNLFSNYVGGEESTKKAFQDGWYTGLKDIAFALKNDDGNSDYYWASRDSELLIRGGANYAYSQIEAELTKFIIDTYKLAPETFHLAVVGIRLESEHEDSCCVTIELINDINNANRDRLESSFLEDAKTSAGKGAKPDNLRFAKIPKNFKGAILYPQLKQDLQQYLKNKTNQ